MYTVCSHLGSLACTTCVMLLLVMCDIETPPIVHNYSTVCCYWLHKGPSECLKPSDFLATVCTESIIQNCGCEGASVIGKYVRV